MKLKFNLQSALVSCFVTIMLSMAIDQDVNAFVAAPFQRNSSEPSSEAPVQVAETSTSETETTSETFMKHGSVPTPGNNCTDQWNKIK